MFTQDILDTVLKGLTHVATVAQQALYLTQ
jgi:hypothetical protein